MESPFGGLQIAGGSANFNAANAGTELGSGVSWAAITPATHGDASVSASTSTGRLTLKPGLYLVLLDLTVEGNHSSGQSGDFAGVITAQLASGGSLVAGTKSKTQTITEGLPMNLHVSAFVEITQASADASTPTNYVSAYLLGGDASGNDVVISEGRLSAIRLN